MIATTFHECCVTGLASHGTRDAGQFSVTLAVAVDLGCTETDIDRIFHTFMGKRVKMTLEVIPEGGLCGARSLPGGGLCMITTAWPTSTRSAAEVRRKTV